MELQPKTIFFIAAGLGLVWLGRKAAKTVTATIEAAQPKVPGVNGFDGLGKISWGRGRVRPPVRSAPAKSFARSNAWAHRFATFEGTEAASATLSEREFRLPMVINPYQADANARVRPWWDTTGLGRNAPRDGYDLQPVASNGTPVNIRAKSPYVDGAVNEMGPQAHGRVAVAAQPQPYEEPGESSYGDMTTTDYGDSMESSTYNPDPGALISQ